MYKLVEINGILRNKYFNCKIQLKKSFMILEIFNILYQFLATQNTQTFFVQHFEV